MVAGEGVINIRTIAAFNAEDRVVKLFERELEEPMKRGFLRGQVWCWHFVRLR
jgi:ATP-binding cassette subfamily B (MDR/TAP) protein 1